MSDSETDEAVRQKLYRGRRPVETDSNGRFRFEGLFPGCGVTIFAAKPGYRKAISFQPTLIPAAGEAKDLGETRFPDLKTRDDGPGTRRKEGSSLICRAPTPRPTSSQTWPAEMMPADIREPASGSG